MATIPKYWLLEQNTKESTTVTGVADTIENIVRQFHQQGERGVVVKTVTWETLIREIAAPSVPTEPQEKP